ncbi:hypothetical protein [Corallococcus sp. Z5C101001]|uniref:hypothetical protein n=1 Tax=Corallococcus sp. Z5C101001 TaxID=2596829 RepID=UPI00117E7769|nr:hypothetical protein [Corallococcus sp. Z5C101001]TSC31179.1 hypothetical protein FOF48_10780 [Corallococcus sp. Z5C101001]
MKHQFRRESTRTTGRSTERYPSKSLAVAPMADGGVRSMTLRHLAPGIRRALACSLERKPLGRSAVPSGACHELKNKNPGFQSLGSQGL